MKRKYQALALAVSLLAAGAAFAQAGGASANANPMARGDKSSFYYGTIHGSAPLNTQSGIGRPVTRYAPVTPVPEPSQWLMMAAGLVLVGFMVRRSSTRS
jgi:hypothetical protein